MVERKVITRTVKTNVCEKHKWNGALSFDEYRKARAECTECIRLNTIWEDEERQITQQNQTLDPEQPYMKHILLTCKNHTDLRWSRKNTVEQRSLFFIGKYDPTSAICHSEFAVDAEGYRYIVRECACPIADLIVLRLLDSAQNDIEKERD